MTRRRRVGILIRIAIAILLLCLALLFLAASIMSRRYGTSEREGCASFSAVAAYDQV